MNKAVIVMLSLLFAGMLPAEKAVEGVNLSQSAGASYNPLGVKLTTKAFYRLPLYDSDSILLESGRVDFGIQNELTPAYERLGVYMEIEPVAVFNLKLYASGVGLFSLLGFGFVPLPSFDSEYAGPEFKARAQYNHLGMVYTVVPTFQIAFKGFALMNSLAVNYFDMGEGGFFLRGTTTAC